MLRHRDVALSASLSSVLPALIPVAFVLVLAVAFASFALSSIPSGAGNPSVLRHRDVALSALLSSVSPALVSLEAFSTK